jgi:hypothetical protein
MQPAYVLYVWNRTDMTCPLRLRIDDFMFTVVRNQKSQLLSCSRCSSPQVPFPLSHGCSLCGAVIRLFPPQLVSAGQATNALPWWQVHSTSVVQFIASGNVGHGDIWIARICTLGNISNTQLHVGEIWGLFFPLNFVTLVLNINL